MKKLFAVTVPMVVSAALSWAAAAPAPGAGSDSVSGIGLTQTRTSLSLTRMDEGVKEVRYTFCDSENLPGDVETLLLENSDAITIGHAFATGALDITGFRLEPERRRYEFRAVALDADGDICGSDARVFVLYNHEYEFYSKALLREATIEQYLNCASGFYDVEVYTAPDAAGHFFICNPYKAHPFLGQYHNGEPDSFMDIDCSDPERINIPEYTVPVNIDFGNATIQSASNYFLTHGETADDIAKYGWFGAYESGGRVTVPQRGTFTGHNGNFYYASVGETFELRFPTFKDYNITLTTEGHAVTVSDCGPDVDHIIVSAAESGSMSIDEILDGIRQSTISCHTHRGDGRIRLESTFDFEEGKEYIVVAVPYDAEGNSHEYRTTNFSIGPAYFSFGLTVMTDAETEEPSVHVTDMGYGIARIDYALVEKDAMTEDEIIGALKDGTQDSRSVTEAGALPLEYFSPETGKTYVAAAVAIDRRGTVAGASTVDFTPMAPLQFAGMGTYTDAFIQILFDAKEFAAPIQVEVYTRGDSHDVVYVREPFRDYLEYWDNHHIGSRYLPIDISDPERVFIPENITGFRINNKDLWCSSYPEVFRNSGYAKEDIPEKYFGKVVDGKVVIPARTLILGGQTILEDMLPEVPNEALELVLPASIAGVEDVGQAECQDAEAEYFDLSGRRVTHPGAGIYIVRRGSAVTKELIR